MTDYSLGLSAFKVLAALNDLRAEHEGGRQPFPASLINTSRKCKVSIPTVVAAYKELKARGYLEDNGNGYYTLVDRSGAVKELDCSKVSDRGSRKNRNNVEKNFNTARSETLEQSRILTKEDRREIVYRACKVLGVKQTPGFIRLAMAASARLARDGHTEEEMLTVARYNRKLWDDGDRWPKRLNLLYVWSVREFSTLLAAASLDDGTRTKKNPIMHDFDSTGVWKEGHDKAIAAVKERSKAWQK